MKVGWSFLATPWLGCGGGEQDPIEPVVEELPAKRAGAVSLANCVVYAIEVAYLNEVDARAPRILSTTVPAGQRTDISDSFLPAGIEVEFALVLIPPITDGVRVRRKIPVAIDGDRYLAVRCNRRSRSLHRRNRARFLDELVVGGTTGGIDLALLLELADFLYDA